MPGDVSLACNADRAHRAGITGKGVKVAMIDSGWYRHPYFVGRGYRAAPVVLGPAAANPLKDESGHGTGESANIFAVAPDIRLLPVKINFVNSLGAFNAAVGLGPDIITCSWGSSIKFGPLSAANQALAAAIASAVASGIVVIFSAGNGHWGFPGQHPNVVSAGGVYMNVNGALQASNYASGFMSNIYPNRRVPDLSGLVGMQPGASYIMLPVEPGDQIDTSRAGGTHPPQDETAANDGWAVFSGTSAAAPQLAGAAALVKQACPRLTPAQVRDILKKSARDVTKGKCHANTGANPATVGPDTATGNGLVNAHKAVLLAKIRCLGPVIVKPPIVKPPTVGPPIVGPPIVKPPTVGPPIVKPPTVGPVVKPPITPPLPVVPQAEAAEQAPSQAEAEQLPSRLTAEDVEALEDMVLGSELDIDDLET
jgi:subtilisin family serine protease